MNLKTAEATFAAWWGRLVLVGGVVGLLFYGFTFARDLDEDMTEGQEHRKTAEPKLQSFESTLGVVVQDLAEQRVSDENFRQQALGTVRQGFEQHDERITGLEDAGKETRFLIREQRTLRQVERARLEQLEVEAKEGRARDAEAAALTREAIEAVRERPPPLVVPAPRAAPTS